MNGTKLWLIVTGIVFVLTTIIFLENPASVGAAETCFPVKICDRDRIEPLNLSANTGDCVVWINFSYTGFSPTPGKAYEFPASDVLISFPKATECVIDEIKGTSKN